MKNTPIILSLAAFISVGNLTGQIPMPPLKLDLDIDVTTQVVDTTCYGDVDVDTQVVGDDNTVQVISGNCDITTSQQTSAMGKAGDQTAIKEFDSLKKHALGKVSTKKLQPFAIPNESSPDNFTNAVAFTFTPSAPSSLKGAEGQVVVRSLALTEQLAQEEGKTWKAGQTLVQAWIRTSPSPHGDAFKQILSFTVQQTAVGSNISFGANEHGMTAITIPVKSDDGKAAAKTLSFDLFKDANK